MAATDVIDEYVSALDGKTRRLAPGEWGVTLAAEHAAGWPLDVGIRLADGLVTAQAPALADPEGIDPWMLLWWNRSTRHARFACTRGREVWVVADLPATAVDEAAIDRLLGLVVEGAIAIREFQRAQREPAPPDEAGGWLGGAGSGA